MSTVLWPGRYWAGIRARPRAPSPRPAEAPIDPAAGGARLPALNPRNRFRRTDEGATVHISRYRHFAGRRGEGAPAALGPRGQQLRVATVPARPSVRAMTARSARILAAAAGLTAAAPAGLAAALINAAIVRKPPVSDQTADDSDRSPPPRPRRSARAGHGWLPRRTSAGPSPRTTAHGWSAITFPHPGRLTAPSSSFMGTGQTHR